LKWVVSLALVLALSDSDRTVGIDPPVWARPVCRQDPKAEPSPEELKTQARRDLDHPEAKGSLDHALAFLKEGVKRHPESKELASLLAEACCRTIEAHEPKAGEPQDPLKEVRDAGLKSARAALSVDADCGPAHYWCGYLILHSAEAESSYRLLKEGLRELETAERLACDIDLAGPLRMQGRIYQETPGWPLLGSIKKAIRLYERAVQKSPEGILNHLWLGEAYQANHQPDLARIQFQWVKSAEARTGHEKEDENARKEAASRLEQLQER